MRSVFAFLLLMLAFAGAREGHAQTFENPLTFSQNPMFQTMSTCNLPYQYLNFLEFGYATNAPAVVYRVFNLQHFRGPPITFKPWHVTMTPQWTDLSIWVCRTHSGNTVSNCSDGSDNGWGIANQVTVPGEAGVFYVIVTGPIDGAPQCGQYMLSAYY